MRAIDADAFIAKCGHWYTEEGDAETGYIGELKYLIEKQPTIQPEIVRCKDCKYCVYSPATPNVKRPCDPPQPEMWHCYKNRDFRPRVMPHDFCSRGKRKEVTT